MVGNSIKVTPLGGRFHYFIKTIQIPLDAVASDLAIIQLPMQ